MDLIGTVVHDLGPEPLRKLLARPRLIRPPVHGPPADARCPLVARDR